MPNRRLVFLCLALALGTAPLAEARPVSVPRHGPVGRVAVVGDGWVRVPASDLKRIDRKAETLSVSRRGRPVPSLVDGDDLVFLALDTAGPHTRRAVFELHRRVKDRRARPPSVVIEKGTEGAPGKTIDLRRYDADRMLGPVAASRREVYGGAVPVWFAGTLPRGGATSFDLKSHRGAARGAQTVSVRVYGTHIGKIALRAAWGETDLGLAEAETAAGGAKLTWRIADATASTVLTLEDASPQPPKPPRNDVTRTRGRIWIDAIELLGEVDVPPTVGTEHFAVLDIEHEDGLPIDATPRFAVLVDDAGNARGTPARIAEAGRLRTNTFGRLCIGPGTHKGKLSPPRPDATHPVSASGRATHVILSTPALMEPAKRLAKHRTFMGTKSEVVSILDVYDQYAGGEHTPQAIRQFVLEMMARNDVPLEYLVLAGDATFDRTDLAGLVTIPTPMARTKYNGATSADRLYTMPPESDGRGGPSLGRLPFRRAEDMMAFVNRLAAYETVPRADETRNMLRFVTSEGRFGPMIDTMLENAFRTVVSEEIDPAYDIEITFASTKSPFFWPPPELNDKVIDALNEGSLFFTYVGHGFAQGFDTLRVGGKYFPILNMEHVDRVDVKGTPPVLVVLACTTAMFDGLDDGIGEALLKRPRGPIAYWGATRICHPASNTLVGRAMAQFMTHEVTRGQLGPLLDRARDHAIKRDPSLGPPKPFDAMIKMGVGMSIRGEETSSEELVQQSAYMFTLLGDPATRLAVPKGDIDVTAEVDGSHIAVKATGDFPDKTKAVVRVEFSRRQNPIQPKAFDDPLDPGSFPTIRENHTGMNQRVIVSHEAVFLNGKMSTRLETGGYTPGWVVKVIVLTDDQIHHGATKLK